ncbi:class I SAM-dependent methyltransferase [Mesorhizobium sp. M0814]|uniref:class I SAM-dependent methyltransferase n=1 Tax=unclassified Mesorhizobium TaxID=325217 RepID=UPI0033379BB9
MSIPETRTWEDAVQWLKSQPDRADLVRACFYDDPLEASARRFHSGTEWTAVQKLLRGRKGKALEIGAGRGIASYALARDGWQVTALEPDPSDVVGAGAIQSLSNATATNIEVVTEWGEKLPFADASFDLVYCRAVLHHARDLRELCAEAGRVLRAGGLMLATREHVISSKTDMDAFLKGHNLHWLYGGENAFLLEEYLSAIRHAKLRIVEVINPLESDINLFPDTKSSVKARGARKLRLPSPALVPDIALKLAGRFSQRPGRLYSFVSTKD